jgi:ketosteroid isomerase-like protein
MRVAMVAILLPALVGGLLGGCSRSADSTDGGRIRQQVLETERAFARSMAERDHAAFARFLSPEAVFFNGDTPLRGNEQIAAAWRQFFDGQIAPFSWEPEQVEVLDSGGLALTSGPVHDPQGTRIGTFTSIWRREGADQWRIVFDKGNAACAAQ